MRDASSSHLPILGLFFFKAIDWWLMTDFQINHQSSIVFKASPEFDWWFFYNIPQSGEPYTPSVIRLGARCTEIVKLPCCLGSPGVTLHMALWKMVILVDSTVKSYFYSIWSWFDDLFNSDEVRAWDDRGIQVKQKVTSDSEETVAPQARWIHGDP